jgi:hypothetical protein
MKTRSLLLLLALGIMLPSVSNGQVGNLIKNKIGRAINAGAKTAGKEGNKEVDSIALKKTEKKVNNNAAGNQNENNLSNKTEGQGNNGQGGINVGNLFGGKVDLKYNEEYNFTSRLYMQTETYDKKEVMKMDLYMYFSANTPTVGMETKSITDEKGNSTPIASSMVMDGENKCFIALTDVNGTKMGVISAMPDENTVQTQPDGKPEKNNTPTNFTKTGNTKVIAGYKCDEYSYTGSDNKSSGKVWFTKDTNLKIDKRGWQKTGMAA